MTRRVARRLTDAALVIVGLSAMLWMDRHQPNLDANQAPFVTRGRIGAAVRCRDFTFAVEKVELARALALEASFGGQPATRETGGVWLIVHARIEGLQEPVTLSGTFGGPRVRAADGTLYLHADDRLPFGYPLLPNGSAAPPGMPVRGILVFELPKARLPGSVLIASRQGMPALDSVAEIDLGLTAADVDRQVAALPASTPLQKGTASW